jgi:anti-sigma regulatory factor (Ser/Thr protein kinase)
VKPVATQTEYFSINDSADLSSAVLRTAHLLLLQEGSDVDRSMIATIVSELGTNIVKYARRGMLRVCRTEHEGAVDIEIWAEDSGPGIADVDLALQDHFSTGGSLGLGLPGVRRMADEFWIRSASGGGTLVFARKRIRGHPLRTSYHHQRSVVPRPSLQTAPAASPHWDVSVSLRPCEGSVACGDAAVAHNCEGGLLLAIVDASGHGERANAIAVLVSNTIVQEGSPDLARLMARIHTLLTGTVGAAAGLVFVDIQSGAFRYLGVGNTRAATLAPQPWHGVSRDGVLGERMPTPLVQTGQLAAGDLLLLWTDGISEFACPRLASAHSFRNAAGIANRLVNDLARPYDDAGCLVLKWLP